MTAERPKPRPIRDDIARLMYLAALHDWEERQVLGDPLVRGVGPPKPEEFTLLVDAQGGVRSKEAPCR